MFLPRPARGQLRLSGLGCKVTGIYFARNLLRYRERNTLEKRYSYCRTLELMCTANHWTRPVILFGRIFAEELQQYVALFTVFRGITFSMFAKVALKDSLDMTSRISEVFLALIEDAGYLPCYNYLVEVEENTAKVGK